MKKNTTTILIIAALGAGAYYAYKKGMFGKGAEAPADAEPGTEPTADKEKTDAVIDTVKQGITIPQAIEKAKEIATQLEDSKILIKTREGLKDIVVRHGAKKKARKELRTTKKKTVKHKRVKRKKSSTAPVTEYSGAPYANAAPYEAPVNPFFKY